MAILASRPTEQPSNVRDAAGRPEWGSDLVLDVLRLLDIPYASLLPGSTFRGIHDSAVNYTANTRPELILCNHEMICVSLARGYARVTGKPMAAILHNVVGLLNASMTIYDAWCDRVPVLILGGTGPLDATRRRPWIDWIHTANVQGNLVRDFTKWDDQPGSVAAIPESLLRAYRLAVTEPAGPVYVCFDVALQEQRLESPVELPDVARFRPAARQAPDPAALRQLADLLVQAELPLALADRVGRSPAAVRALVELAELLAMPVVNLGGRHSFPTSHPLDFTADLLPEADVVLGLDVIDLEGSMRLRPDPVTRAARKLTAERQRVASISLDELIHRGLTADYQALPAVDLPILADTSLAIPLLVEACRAALDGNARSRIDVRRQRLADRQAQLRERQQAYLRQQWDHPRITEARLAAELWQAIQAEDIVLTAGRPQRMAPGVFQLRGPEQSAAGGGGGAVGAGPGVALGAALALKHSGKLPLAILGDGEMLSSIQALWTAAHYRLPSLWVINTNRSYYNDEDHQDRIAQVRGRPPENKWVAMRMQDPEVDFAALARTFGVHGEGPIKEAADIGPAVRRAVEVVKHGGFAVVDVWTEPRSHG
jgi:thiamine pyrophosphate-dependent acetolactate synthase large subunit-like protein